MLHMQRRQSELAMQQQEIANMTSIVNLRRQQLALGREEAAHANVRHQQLARELDLTRQLNQAQEHGMAVRERFAPMCKDYLDMTREKASLLHSTVQLRYDSLRAEYTPSPNEFTFFDACVDTASLLMAEHKQYCEPFDVWIFCSQPVWFGNTTVGTVNTYITSGPANQRPQPLWFYVPKVLGIGFVRRAGSGTEMVNHYANLPGKKEQMARFIMRHVLASSGRRHAFQPPYGVSMSDDSW